MTLGKLPYIDDPSLFKACSWAQKLMQGNDQYPPKDINPACSMAARKYRLDPADVKAIVETTVPGIRPETDPEPHGEALTLASLDRKLDIIIGMLRKDDGAWQ